MDIGRKLQEVRKKRGLSQRELAGRAGLTNGTISLIEKNKTSPSIASLKSLLDAIPMSMSEFFSSFEDTDASKCFYSKSEFIEIAPQIAGLSGKKSDNISLLQLGQASGRALQVLFETYPPGSDTGTELLSHDGEEAGIVIEGEVEVTVGNQVQVLAEGEGYIFDSTLPHRFRNISTTKCVLVSASTPPTF